MKALFDYDGIKDNRRIFPYEETGNENVSAELFYKKINHTESYNLTEKIWTEYRKSQEESDDDSTPPDRGSFLKSVHFIKKINGYRSFVKSVCVLGDGGFSFRFQANDTEHIDIDIYNGDSTFVFLHSKKGEKTEAFDLSLKDLIIKLKGVLKKWENAQI
ncbi:MAG TPA: hypothetical protein PK453_03865 [Leptospiraceae bacterium]|nr:hypothetical protein [Leptospiraceae bacterium]HNH09233.1 hypothetical protein [Leptospiraceae bacterium]HNI97681.1 hypothetical protein [Leptospiraceae bacterium]HNM05278.1 hypothetical protein [Leptospiraceae bacterium]HNN06678.1 hypothetical protein [Leptospiraceae bacterium]